MIGFTCCPSPREVVLLGAHCDDIAIGLGGTLLALSEHCGNGPALHVRALVLTGAGTVRATEERAALAALCPGTDLDLTILDLPDGYTPAHWWDAKAALSALAGRTSPDIVFAPRRGDMHQDHRLLAELAPTEFRDHLVLGYEILKRETETWRPTFYHPLTDAQAHGKARALTRCYPSQRDKDWFDETSFLALLRLRGLQCRSPHAEAFASEKSLVSFAPAPHHSATEILGG